MSDGKRSEGVGHAVTSAAVGDFLRALAQRADADPTFAAHLLAALDESGLARALTEQPSTSRGAGPASGSSGSRARANARAAATPTSAGATEEPPPDPFSVYRAHGEERLRTTLETLELTTLRAIVRAHRLDPARISARWTARERVISLIVDQVKARANHGRAFERV